MRTPLVSVIICTYNRSSMLQKALEVLTHQETEAKFSYEVVVIDDASTDETKHVVEAIASRSVVPIEYVREDGNGYSHALNRGLIESRGEWLAFFDDDESSAPDWLRELLGVALTTGADLVGGPIIVDFEGPQPMKPGPVCRAICGEHPGFRDRKKRHHIPLPGGGNRLVRRTVFDAIGGFDETMLTGGCDKDIVLRARAAGFCIAWAPGAVVRHAIKSQRLRPQQMKRYSLQAGASTAYIQWKQQGLPLILLAAIARVARAVLVKTPQLCLAFLRRNPFDILDVKITHWTAEGYTRTALFLVAPRLFPQRDFFEHSQFRKLREHVS